MTFTLHSKVLFLTLILANLTLSASDNTRMEGLDYSQPMDVSEDAPIETLSQAIEAGNEDAVRTHMIVFGQTRPEAAIKEKTRKLYDLERQKAEKDAPKFSQVDYDEYTHDKKFDAKAKAEHMRKVIAETPEQRKKRAKKIEKRIVSASDKTKLPSALCRLVAEYAS